MNQLKMLHGAAAILFAAALAAPALGQDEHPDAHIRLHGGSAGFIVGAHWGSGTLTYHGRHIPLKVSGLGVGTIGVSSFDAHGEVYNLHRTGDIEGVYAAVEASATAGSGAGVLDMKNGNGVEIRVTADTTGLKLSLAPTGMNIALK